MRILTFRHASLGICTAIMLAGCGGSQPPINAPDAVPQASGLVARTTSTNYKVVYSFGAAPDGISPAANLIDADCGAAAAVVTQRVTPRLSTDARRALRRALAAPAIPTTTLPTNAITLTRFSSRFRTLQRCRESLTI